MPARRACGRPSGRSRLRHLLTHTAGFGYETWDADLIRYVKVSGTPSTSTGKLASLRLPLVFDPGDRWEYGINLDWVGRAVEAVSGQPLEVYFREHIFAPLGMADTDYVISSAQQSRLVSVHQRKPDDSLEPIAAAGSAVARILERRRRSLFDRTRLPGVSADAAAIRAASTAPSCCARKPSR